MSKISKMYAYVSQNLLEEVWCRMRRWRRQRWDWCVRWGAYRRAPSRIMSLECKYAREDYHRVAGVAFSPLFLWHRDVVFVSMTVDVCAAVFVCLRERARVWHTGICFLLEKVNYISTGWLDVPCIITHPNETCVWGRAFVFCMCIHNTPPYSCSKDISATCFSSQGPLLRKEEMHVLAEVATQTGDNWEGMAEASMDTPPLGISSHTRTVCI